MIKISNFNAFELSNESYSIDRYGSAWHYLFLDIYMCLKEFYALMAVDAMKKLTPFKHSHKKWEEDYENYKNEFIDNLANVVYEYTVSAVLTELRHCDRSNYYITQFSRDSREEALEKLKFYTPESILRLGVKMFDTSYNYWLHSYGGTPWQKIAEAGLMYGKIPNLIFIDHCVDLCHNNGSYFDKFCYITGLPLDISQYQLLGFLNEKKHELYPQRIACNAQSYALQSLIIRGNNLGIFSLDCDFEFEEQIDSPLEKNTLSSSFSYSNKWYKEDNKKCEGYNKILFDDVFNYYHHIEFGKKDFYLLAEIVYNPKYTEDGDRIERRRKKEEDRARGRRGE